MINLEEPRFKTVKPNQKVISVLVTNQHKRTILQDNRIKWISFINDNSLEKQFDISNQVEKKSYRYRLQI